MSRHTEHESGATPARTRPETSARATAEHTGAPGAGARATTGYPSGGGVSLGWIGGVEVRADWSLLILFALVSVGLGASVLPAWHPGWSLAWVWGTALGAALLFFASILAHELSHSFVARALGLPVRRVTLFLFGGVAHLEEEPRSPGVEFRVAVVGPLVSLAIGCGAWLLGAWIASPALSAEGALEDPAGAMAQVGPLATLLLWLGPVNVLLGVFNLVPGFPLDGGRVLRSFLWWTTGDLVKASRWAAAAGQAFAWLLMAFGAWSLFAGGLGQGLWLLLIGWFLNNAARASYERLLVHRALEGVSVREIMSTRVERVSPELGAGQLIDDYFLASDQRAFPVDAADGRFLGLVCFEDVRRLPAGERARAHASDVMTAAADLATVSPDARVERALEELVRRDVEQLPVLEGGRLLGLVRRRDIVKWLSVHGVGARAGLAART